MGLQRYNIILEGTNREVEVYKDENDPQKIKKAELIKIFKLPNIGLWQEI